MAWQKARVIKAGRSDYDHLLGATFWVEAEPPFMHAGYDGLDETPSPPCLSFTTNLVGGPGNIKVNRNVIELLPEFCDEPPRILWRDFIKGDSHDRN